MEGGGQWSRTSDQFRKSCCCCCQCWEIADDDSVVIKLFPPYWLGQEKLTATKAKASCQISLPSSWKKATPYVPTLFSLHGNVNCDSRRTHMICLKSDTFPFFLHHWLHVLWIKIHTHMSYQRPRERERDKWQQPLSLRPILHSSVHLLPLISILSSAVEGKFCVDQNSWLNWFGQKVDHLTISSSWYQMRAGWRRINKKNETSNITISLLMTSWLGPPKMHLY